MSVEEQDVHDPTYLSALGEKFNDIFGQTGTLEDIDQAVQHLEKAVQLTADDQISKPIYLNNLALSLHSRFWRIGEYEDLEAAVLNEQKAILLTPDDHFDKPMYMINLGRFTQSRWVLTGELKDLDEAIKNQQQAVLLTPDDHCDKPLCLSNLAIVLDSRFRSTGDLNSLDEAIRNQQQVLLLTADSHTEKAGYHRALMSYLVRRYERTGELNDLEAAIWNQQQYILLTSNDGDNQSADFSELGSLFQRLYVRTEQLDDLEAAIRNLQQAVLLTPDGNAGKPRHLHSLGISFESRYRLKGEPVDMERSINSFRSSAISSVGQRDIRFKAARRWAELEAERRSSAALEGLEVGMQLLPQVVSSRDSIDRRHELLVDFASFPREAAALALQFDQADRALEWLAHGRSIVWNQLLDLQTPLEDLHKANAALCKEFEDASNRLRSVSTQQSEGSYIALTDQWEALLGKIRCLKGFEDFLMPRRIATLKSAADSGSVVVINIHRARCDALVLERVKDHVRHIPLVKLHYDKVHEMQQVLHSGLKDWYLHSRGDNHRGTQQKRRAFTAQLERVLSYLYTAVAEPILDSLGLLSTSTPGSSSDLPRIFWCPTEALTFLPLHAARKIVSGRRYELSDYVVSSYISTITSLLSARSTERPSFKHLLAVAMVETQGGDSLPNASNELTAIRKAFGSIAELEFDAIQNEQATKERVLLGMQNSSWIHMACHASQNAKTPLSSGFRLHDSRLTISEIIKKPFTKGDFAYLSACETATGAEEIADEAVHITGALIATGYRSVIGTMWSIPDDAAPIVAEQVYKTLLADGKPSSEHAARALHEGVKALRSHPEGESLYSWVPFVHYGV